MFSKFKNNLKKSTEIIYHHVQTQIHNTQEYFFPPPPIILSLREKITHFFHFLMEKNNHPNKEIIHKLLEFNPKNIFPMIGKPISYLDSKNKKIYLYLYDNKHSLIDRTLDFLTKMVIVNLDFLEKRKIILDLYLEFVNK
jgi:hypothetical protein